MFQKKNFNFLPFLSSLFIFLLIICSSAVTYAFPYGGAGGLFYGAQGTNLLFSQLPLPNISSGLSYFGLYGYGVSNNCIIGGFGFATLSNSIWTEADGVAGGFGGLISGYKILDRFIQINLMVWLGLGGFGIGNAEDSSGFFGYYAEVNLEIGIKLQKWMYLFFYIGYQTVGNLIPGPMYTEFHNSSPVFGARLAFGSF